MAKAGLPEKVLLVDDDQAVLNNMQNMLSSYGVKVIGAKDLSSALYRFKHEHFDVAIAELEFDEVPGTVLIQKWKTGGRFGDRETAFVITSGVNRGSSEEALMTELGNIAIINKPLKQGQVLSVLSNAVKTQKQLNAIAKLKKDVIDPLLANGNGDKAVAVSEKKLLPLGSKGQYITATVQDRAGNTDKAIAYLENLISKESNNMAYVNELARIYTANGNLLKAEEYYNKADKIAPHSIDRLNEMATLYLRLKEPDKSIAKFKEIIKLSPESPTLKFDMYQRLFDQGFESHARDFVSETSTPRELIRYYNNKGVMCSKKSEFSEAIAEYQRAVDLIPGNKELYRILYNMAIAHINKKTLPDIQEAHVLLEKCLKVQPNYEKAIEKMKITSKYVKSAG